MGKFIDLTGQKFNHLTVLHQYTGKPFRKKKETLWVCKCDCGSDKEVIATSYELKSNNTQSCGCHKRLMSALNGKKSAKHNMSNTKLYNVWDGMKDRCLKPKIESYEYYGGRGITICDEWLDDKNGFLNFYNWAINNGYQEGLTIDRINNDGNYEPDNCRWVTMKVQNNNKRNNHLITIDGETKNIAQWADEYNISPCTIYTRENKQCLSGTDLLTTPYSLYKNKSK